MKKGLIHTALALLLIALLSGCIKIPTETPVPSASPAATPTPTPSPSISPTPAATPAEPETPVIATTPTPAIKPSPKPSTALDSEAAEKQEMFKDMRVTNGEWIYYADWKHMTHIKEEYECPIRRVKTNGSGDTGLGITGFKFILAGNYIYVYKNLTFGDFGHWETVRMGLNGSNQKKMPYDQMDIKVFDGRIYFDPFNENALYTADSGCEQVKKYTIKLPDEATIIEKMGADYAGYVVFFPDIKEVKNGWIYFNYRLDDTGGMPYYEGNYRMSLDGKTVEKTDKGEFDENLIKTDNN